MGPRDSSWSATSCPRPSSSTCWCASDVPTGDPTSSRRACAPEGGVGDVEPPVGLAHPCGSVLKHSPRAATDASLALELLAQLHLEVLDSELPGVERPGVIGEPLIQVALLVGVQVRAAVP